MPTSPPIRYLGTEAKTVIEQNLTALYAEFAAATPELSNTVRNNTFALFSFIYASVYKAMRLQGLNPAAATATVLWAGTLLQIEFDIARNSYKRYVSLLSGSHLLATSCSKVKPPPGWNYPLLNAGTRAVVRLHPGNSQPVRLHPADVAESCTRDMEHDLLNGNTVTAYEGSLTSADRARFKARRRRWKAGMEKIDHITIPEEWEEDVQTVSQFLLPSESPYKTPLIKYGQKSTTVVSPLPHWTEHLTIDDVSVAIDAEPQYAAATINSIATSVVHRLGDLTGMDFWCKFLWRIRAVGRNHTNYSAAVHTLVTAFYREMDEGEIRRPAAVLVSRLKKNSMWGPLMDPSGTPDSYTAARTALLNSQAADSDRAVGDLSSAFEPEPTTEQREFLRSVTSTQPMPRHDELLTGPQHR